MNMSETDVLAPNLLRLAYDFMAAFAADRISALTHLRVMLDSMEEWQYRQWVEHLGTILVEEERTVEEWHAMFSALESLDVYH